MVPEVYFPSVLNMPTFGFPWTQNLIPLSVPYFGAAMGTFTSSHTPPIFHSAIPYYCPNKNLDIFIYYWYTKSQIHKNMSVSAEQVISSHIHCSSLHFLIPIQYSPLQCLIIFIKSWQRPLIQRRTMLCSIQIILFPNNYISEIYGIICRLNNFKYDPVSIQTTKTGQTIHKKMCLIFTVTTRKISLYYLHHGNIWCVGMNIP